MPLLFDGQYKVKQGQGNQCQAPGVKFEEKTGRKGENKMKQEKIGRKKKTGRKNTENRREKKPRKKQEETGRNKKKQVEKVRNSKRHTNKQ